HETRCPAFAFFERDLVQAFGAAIRKEDLRVVRACKAMVDVLLMIRVLRCCLMGELADGLDADLRARDGGVRREDVRTVDGLVEPRIGRVEREGEALRLERRIVEIRRRECDALSAEIDRRGERFVGVRHFGACGAAVTRKEVTRYFESNRVAAM